MSKNKPAPEKRGIPTCASGPGTRNPTRKSEAAPNPYPLTAHGKKADCFNMACHFLKIDN